ncbi:MAG: DoxX family protein [Acidobacteriota bacterium]
MRRFFPEFLGGWRATALLFMRAVMGVAFILHGLPKIQNPMNWMDAMGLSNVPGFIQALAAVIEFGGGLALVLGLLTPLAALGIVCQMLGALILVHLPKGDSFVATAPGQSSFEPALVYLALAGLLLAVGPGRYSLDYWLFGRGSAIWHERQTLREV